MRWSLILFTLVLSTLSAALVIPSESVDLERRARSGPSGAKLSSKKYRQNAQDHHHIYKFDHQTGAVTRDWLKKKDRRTSGKKLVAIPKTDADHVFEHQMLMQHLEDHGLKHDDLHPGLKKDIKHILNRPGNMALVPAGVNRGKGQLIKKGMLGKALKKPKKNRDEYALHSYPTAKRTAKLLDEAFEKHGHNFGDKTLHAKLRKTMNNSGIMKPGDSSPPSSPGSSGTKGSGSGGSSPSHHGSSPSHHGSDSD